MKPNSGFVLAMLTAFSVASAEMIPRSKITTEHLRLMHNDLSPGARELIAELSSIADKTMEPSVLLAEEKGFLEAGLWHLTEDERILICRIYGRFGREVEITPCGIIVPACQRVLEEKKRLLKRLTARVGKPINPNLILV